MPLNVTEPLKSTFTGAEVANGIESAVLVFVQIIIVLAIVALIIYFVVMARRYRNTFILKDVTKDRKIISIEKAWEYDDKTGRKEWKLKDSRKSIPVPPQSAIETMRNGTKFVEAYRLPDGTFVYNHDTAKEDDLIKIESFEYIRDEKNNILFQKDTVGRPLLDNKGNKVPQFAKITKKIYPLATDDREFYVNQLKIAAEEESMSWLSKNGAAIMVMIFMLVMVVIAVSFWGKIMQPMQVAGENFVQASASFDSASARFEKITEGVQTIKGANLNETTT